jgi:uncharacterized protein YkwD
MKTQPARHLGVKSRATLLSLAVTAAVFWLALALLAHAESSDLGKRPAAGPGFVLSDTYLFMPLAQQALPTPTPTSTAQPEPDWLAYLNSFRGAAGVPRLAENGDWSAGAWLHSRYMVKNGYVGHDEVPNNPWYSPEGQVAGQKGNVFVTSWLAAGDETAINFWMAAPFHAIAMLDPQLHTTGFGRYNEPAALWQMAATLDVGRGLGALPPDTHFPIIFPPPEGQAPLLRYYGGEFPDPLSSCPGYSAPSGPPLMIQLGSGSLTPVVAGHGLWLDDTLIQSCLFHEGNYSNSNSAMQSSGRVILNYRDAVVIMPRQPLLAGHSYQVSLDVNGELIEWSFSTSALENMVLPDALFQAP